MELPVSEAIVGLVCAALTFVATKGLDFFKLKSEAKLAERQQNDTETKHAVEIYRDIIEELKKDAKEMLTRIHYLEKCHLECREENAALRSDVKELRERMLWLETKKV